MTSLQTYWAQLIEQCQLDHKICEQVFEGIIGAYQQSHRHYHDLSHLEHMWSMLNTLPESVEITPQMQLALWYHDIVYQPGKDDNELKSAQCLVVDNISLKFSDYIVNRACRMIMATKDHSAQGDINCRYFLDADMAILGSEPSSYQQYAKAIADEHQHIASFLYRRGRKKFLTRTLAQPQIFHTEHFNQRFEQQARENLQQELNQL